jgi:uncharacterized protein Smg (DUF494 family)
VTAAETSTVNLDHDDDASQGQDISSIRLPRQIIERIERRLRNSEFQTVEDYAAFVLDQVLSELEEDGSVSGSSGSQTKQVDVFSKEDQEDVEQRLRDLGYI